MLIPGPLISFLRPTVPQARTIARFLQHLYHGIPPAESCSKEIRKSRLRFLYSLQKSGWQQLVHEYPQWCLLCLPCWLLGCTKVLQKRRDFCSFSYKWKYLFFFHLVIVLLSEFLLLIISLLTDPVFIYPLFSWLPCEVLPERLWWRFTSTQRIPHEYIQQLHNISSSLKETIIFFSYGLKFHLAAKGVAIWSLCYVKAQSLFFQFRAIKKRKINECSSD